ncbi:MAG TPA: DMT family transporter [Candidatus Limnocylindrales bacterium]|nr:DMT family transporter [Candidatus Limnocylindrales bacterium]
MNLPSDAALGALGALGSACTWAVTTLLVRSLSPRLNSVSVNAIRSTVGGTVLLAWVAASGGIRGLAEVSLAGFALLVVSIVLAIGIGDTIFFESVRILGLARAMTVSMTYPLLSALLAAAVLGEPLTLPLLAGSALTLGGLVLIVATRDEALEATGQLWSGVRAATLASVAWAISVVALKVPLAEMDAITAQAIRLPMAGLLLWATPWAWDAAARVRSGGRATVGIIVALSLLTAVSSVMFVAGVKYAGVAMTTVLSSTAPMFAIPLGMIFLGERLTPAAILGTITAVAGIAVMQL